MIKSIILAVIFFFYIPQVIVFAAGKPSAKIIADNSQSFSDWLIDLEKEARAAGVSDQTFAQAFAGVTPNPKVIDFDRHQPEFTQTYDQYITRRISPARVKRGREKIAENSGILRDVSTKIGVQPRFIAGIWGMETNFGSFSGGYNVIRSLATLAYDTRRPRYFRSELIKALTILEQGHVGVKDFKGSWAGAMGQGQFMPSSFFAYAYDFDGDGRKDIWNDTGDVVASIANYLKKHGWQQNRTWGREVTLPEDIDALWDKVKQTGKVKTCRRALKDHSRRLTLAEWQKLGVRTIYGQDLPKVTDPDFVASLVMPAGKGGPAYLTYPNFRAILSYNCSNFYALGVSLLAEKLK